METVGIEWGSMSFLIGNVAGAVFKHRTNWNNKFIPLLVLAVQVITRFVSGAGGSLTPTDAAFAGTTLVWWGSFGGILELAFADTVKSVFAHTITKNFSQGIKRTG